MGRKDPLLAKLDQLQGECADLRRQVGESRAQQLERAAAAAREQLEDVRRVNAGARCGVSSKGWWGPGAQLLGLASGHLWRAVPGSRPGLGCLNPLPPLAAG